MSNKRKPSKRPRKQLSGSTKMIRRGYKPMLLFLTPNEHAMVKRVAARLSLPMSTIVKNAAMYDVRKADGSANEYLSWPPIRDVAAPNGKAVPHVDR